MVDFTGGVSVVERQAGPTTNSALAWGASSACGCSAAWGHNNLWGTGRRVQVRARRSWNVDGRILGTAAVRVDPGQINYRVEVRYVNPCVFADGLGWTRALPLAQDPRRIGAEPRSAGARTSARGAPRRTPDQPRAWASRPRGSGRCSIPDAPDGLQARFQGDRSRVTHVRALILRARYVEHGDDLFRPTAGSPVTAGGGRRRPARRQQRLRQGIGRLAPLPALRRRDAGPAGGSRGGTRPTPVRPIRHRGGAVRGAVLRRRRRDRARLQQRVPRAAGDGQRRNWTTSATARTCLVPDDPPRGGNYLLLANLEWRVPLPVIA